jgi:hypothetical protein
MRYKKMKCCDWEEEVMIFHQLFSDRAQKDLIPTARRSRFSTRRWRCALLLSFALLGVAACGSETQGGDLPQKKIPAANSSSNSGPVLLDPCMLFPRDSVSQMFGAKIAVSPDIAGPACRYTTAENATDRKSSTRKSLVVSVGRSDDAAGYFAFEKTTGKGAARVQSVANVGDEAFFVALPIGGTMAVRRGSAIFSMTMVNPGTPASVAEDMLKKLAIPATQTVASGGPALAFPATQTCQLVTAQEASHEFQGRPVHWLLTANAAGVASCDYISSLGNSSHLMVMTHEKQSGARELFQQNAAQLTKKKALTGIGDEAFFDGVNTAIVRKQDAFFYISVLGLAHPDQISERLARQAASRFVLK